MLGGLARRKSNRNITGTPRIVGPDTYQLHIESDKSCGKFPRNNAIRTNNLAI